jgi:hypothetical protein
MFVATLHSAAQGAIQPVVQAAGGKAAEAVAGRIHGTVDLDGPWRFQVGDNPQWAAPDFDDSAWPTVTLGKPLVEQGIEPYAGYGWYRLRLHTQMPVLQSLMASEPLDALVSGYLTGQLDTYVNGVEAGHTGGMTNNPRMYLSLPIVVHLSSPRPDGTPEGTIVIAIRTWSGPGMSIRHGLLDHVEAGGRSDIATGFGLARANRWDQKVVAGMMLTFMFFGVAALGAILFVAQRHHKEYFWMSMLALSVAITGVIETAYQLALVPLFTFQIADMWMGRVFMAVTLEFVLRFTATKKRTLTRSVQAAVLVLPALWLLQLEQTYEALSITAEIMFTALVCTLLFRAWRHGQREAGVMLAPFFLAATADSIDTVLDYAASKHWLSDYFFSHRFHLGPIEYSTSDATYSVFLASLIAVILYRFVRVSQEEQRTTAEIAAARSVQALLIPTELPSNRYFMLESAYFPVNGVGGDFFQVLPLQDHSMLVVVGDVSGKGLQAAMNASTLVGALRNELSHDPATVLNHLNHVMLGARTPESVLDANAVASFATCLCARVFPDGRMTIANAGHLSPYRDGREIELPPGLPLGVIGGIEYEQVEFRLDQGDRLIFLSDGVVEATNLRGELFGFERTQQVSHEPARFIAQTAQRFGQNDDITVVSLYVASKMAQRVELAATPVG